MLKCEKKYFCGLLLMMFVTSCHTYKSGVTGTYKSVTYSRMQQAYLMLLRHKTYVLNSSLIIKEDSSYGLANCGNIENGHWRLRHDSLILYCEEKRYAIDSLNVTGFKSRVLNCGDGKPEIFTLRNGKLKQRYQMSDGRTVLYDFKKQQ